MINTNDLIVEANGKKYVTTQGIELGLPAQVTSTVTTTPLRIILADNKKFFNWVCLLAFRWGLGSNLLGSPFNIAIKK
jgi:hypothetical protein